MNRAGKHRWTVPDDTLSLIRELTRITILLEKVGS
jgi:hypothetical protein